MTSELVFNRIAELPPELPGEERGRNTPALPVQTRLPDSRATRWPTATPVEARTRRQAARPSVPPSIVPWCRRGVVASGPPLAGARPFQRLFPRSTLQNFKTRHLAKARTDTRHASIGHTAVERTRPDIGFAAATADAAPLIHSACRLNGHNAEQPSRSTCGAATIRADDYS